MKSDSDTLHLTGSQGISPDSLLARKLAGYLAGAAGTAAVLAAPQSDAAVVAVEFGFGPVLSASDGNYFQPVDGASYNYGYILGAASATFLYLGAPGYLLGGAAYQNKSFDATTGLAVFFANGTVIGGGANVGASSGLGYGFFQSTNLAANFASDQLNKNIGFKTSDAYWGWANVSWDSTLKTLTINAAYIDDALGPITVGDTGAAAAPEPSRALLALAGLCGVALRRRRKQAA
jgi:MYXO-CTERM domain-containing protein